MVIIPLAFVYLLTVIGTPAKGEPSLAGIKCPSAERRIATVSFDMSMAELSKKYKVCILCEGLPFRYSVDGDAVETLQTILANEKVSVDDKIAAVAKAFDYSVENNAPNCFLLSKNFSFSGDIPEVSFDEVRRAIRNLQTYTNDVHVDDSDNNMSAFFASLNEEQKQQIKTGMSISEFNPEQQAALRRFAWTFPLAGADDIKKVALRLQGCRSPKASFAREDFYGATYPIYKGPFGLHHEEWKVVLGLWVNTQSGGGTTFNGVRGRVDLVDNQIVTLEVDPTTPQSGKGDTLQPSSATLTLGILPTKLKNCTSAEVPEETVDLRIDECISGKHICLFGEENIDSRTLINATTKLYNLRVVTKKGNAILLTTQIARTLQNPNDFSKEVRRLVPISFWRALDNGMAAETKRLEALPIQSLESAFGDSDPDFAKLEIPRYAKIATRTRLYTDSVRRLRKIVEPLLDKVNPKSLRMLDAPPEALDQVALSSLITLTNDLLSIPDIMPTYINYFEQAKIALQVSSPSPKWGVMTYKIWCMPTGAKGGNVVVGRFDGIKIK